MFEGALGYDELFTLEEILVGVDSLYLSLVGRDEIKSKIKSLVGTLVDKVYSVSSKDMSVLVDTDYLDPDRMGLDRWLAIYAILTGAGGFKVIVDAGTAMTIDVVGDHRHLGGFIVPGYHSQITSLSVKAALPEPVGVLPGISLGVDTMTCMERGVWVMLSSFIEAVFSEYPRAELHLTGGDARHLAGLVGVPCTVHNNLVLDGLVKFRSRMAR